MGSNTEVEQQGQLVNRRRIELDRKRTSNPLEGFAREGSRLAVGPIPMDPARAAARSDKISAWRFVATMVSRDLGSWTIRTVIASTLERKKKRERLVSSESPSSRQED